LLQLRRKIGKRLFCGLKKNIPGKRG